jgi:nucleoside-diphosphate-sugar epimerase
VIVVTGAAGFIGRALVAALDAAGHRVVAVDRSPLPPPSARSVPLRADLTAGTDEVRDALRSADAVFHLAGRPGVRDPHPAADLLRERDNVLATREVLRHVRSPVPLVVTSSSAVYGGSRGGRPCRETDPLRPLGGYARSKAAAEWLCAQRRLRGGLIAVARPFTVAGEGQRSDMALARFIAALRAGQPVVLHGSPDRTRDVTDVRDVVRALRGLADRGVCGPVNVGTSRPYSLAELVAAVSRGLGQPAAVVLRPAAPDDPPATRADTRRLRRLLGFQPRTDLDDLVRRQLAAPAPPPAPVPAELATPGRPRPPAPAELTAPAGP